LAPPDNPILRVSGPILVENAKLGAYEISDSTRGTVETIAAGRAGRHLKKPWP